jgi:hypothetical protein
LVIEYKVKNLMDKENKKIKKPEEKTPTKSLLEDWPSFCAWEQALDNSRSKGIPAFLQEPEDKQKNKEEGKPLSEQNTQQDASTQPGQGVISNAYTASEEVESKEWTYEDLMNQLQNLEKQIKQVPSASYAELAALKRKLADLNKEIAKRATMRDLSKKISELSKQLQQPEDEEDSESEETEAAEAESAESKRASGKDTVDTIQDAA